MPPQIDETIVDKLSILDSGFFEVAGRVALSNAEVMATPTAWLRLTKRGTTEFRLISGSLSPDRSGHSSFRFEIDLRNETGYLGDDTLDAHLVLRSEEGEVAKRLPWPAAFNRWVAYPTIYGNLSVKRAVERQEENE